ncbi:restriction endonuclease subunit S [Prevotella sp.]
MIEYKVHISDIISSQRLNVSLFIGDAIKGEYTPLARYVEIKGGKCILKGEYFSPEPTNYLYLRLTDIEDFNNLDYAKLPYLREEVYQSLKRYEIKEEELVFSIAGTIGQTFIVRNIPSGKKVILTENCAKLLIKDVQTLSVDFLNILLQFDFIQNQIAKNRVQTPIPKIGIERIGKIQIPLLPELDQQRSYVAQYDNAVQILFNNKQEYSRLLGEISDYLFSELHIKRSSNGGDKVNRINVSALIGKMFRLSDNRYGKSIEYPSLHLYDIAYIEKGKALSKKNINQGDIPVISGGQMSPYNHDVSNYNGNVITISASGAYAGYVWYHRTPIFASDCIVICSKDESVFKTEYIYEVLKAQQEYLYSLQRGAAQPHVYAKDLNEILIPKVSIEKQEEIVHHITNIRNHATQLLVDGNKNLEKVKQEIEKNIIK